MRLSVTTAIKDILTPRFEALLQNAPELADVEFAKDDRFVTYNMIQYSIRWSQFAKVATNKITEHLKEPLGVFTRKHSKDFLVNVKMLVWNITAQEIIECKDRYRTWAD